MLFYEMEMACKNQLWFLKTFSSFKRLINIAGLMKEDREIIQRTFLKSLLKKKQKKFKGHLTIDDGKIIITCRKSNTCVCKGSMLKIAVDGKQ